MSSCKAASGPLQHASGHDNIPNYTSFKDPQQTVNIVKPRFIAFSEDDLIFVTTGVSNEIQYDGFLVAYKGFGNKIKIYLESSTRRYAYQYDGVSGICTGRNDVKGQSVLYLANNIEGFVYKTNAMWSSDVVRSFDDEPYGHVRLWFSEFAESKHCINQDIWPPKNRQFSHPWALCIGPNDKIYVVESGNNHIKVFYTDDGALSHIIDLNVLDNGKLQCPKGLVFDPSGYLHVTCFSSNKVAVFSPEGQYIRHYGQSHLKGPCGIAIDSAGNSLIANEVGNSLTIFNQSGTYIHSVGGFKCPMGVAIDPHNGSVWVADTGNNRLVNYY